MAERSPADIAQAESGAPGDRTTAALAPLRERIDAIDHEIVALLNERAQIALEIGRVKEQTGRRTVRDSQREAEVLERVTSASAGLFPEPELVALYRKLIAATRRVQHAQKRAAAGAGAEGSAMMGSADTADAAADDDVAGTSPGAREE
jgi:chorismate mutase